MSIFGIVVTSFYDLSKDSYMRELKLLNFGPSILGLSIVMLRMKQILLMVLFLFPKFLHAKEMNSYHPFLENSTNFNIKWNALLPKYVEQDIATALEIAQKEIDEIASTPINKLTFENTVLALERSGELLSSSWELVGHLDSTCNSSELREAYNKMLPKVSEFHSNILLNDDLWARIKKFSESDEAKQLNEIDKKLVQDTVDGFIDSGANLPKQQREKLRDIHMELSQLSQKFSENVLDSVNAWEKYVDNVNELNGLPKIMIDMFADDAKAKGHSGYRITLNPPSLAKCMQYLENEKLREEIYRSSLNVGAKAPYDNKEIVNRILELRDESAKILGHKTFADMQLKRRMAKNGTAALSFIEKLHDRTLKFFQKEKGEMEDFRASFFNSEKQHMKPWEVSYLCEKYRKSKFNFDEEELRPYFKLENVLNGLFSVANALYGVKFIEQKTFFSEDEHAVVPDGSFPVWHKDVKYFEAFDENGYYIGSLYLDIYPRETKKAGGWMSGIRTGHFGKDGKWKYPVVVVCTNLTPPTSTTPSLLTHREVETLFHEFGHTLHHLFGTVKYESMNGADGVEWDFVEMPSQFMENFCWDRASLDTFARHYVTNEPIPEDLFQKMLAARNHLSGSSMMGQLCYAKLDLELHQKYNNYKGCNINDKLDKVLKSYRYELSEKVPTIIYAFSHIFSNGYAAGYYSYKWAEVLEADIFNKFKKDGILSRRVGEEFREKVLSKGGSKEADELFRDFMGRDPDIEPLFIRSGLVD